MPSKELYIGNIDPDTKSQEIRDIFEQYGDVNRCEVKFGGSGKIKRTI
jgi:RNA recognition motif-containing protein